MDSVMMPSSSIATQTPLRRSQRRGSSNRLLDRNQRPSSARSSQRRGSNSQVLDNSAGSPNLTRHRRHGSSGQLVDEPGMLQRRGSRERVLESRGPAGAASGRPPGSGHPAVETLRNPGHQRRGSDSQLLDNRAPHFDTQASDAMYPQRTRAPVTNLSIDSSTEALQPSTGRANAHQPPIRTNNTPYTHMSPSAAPNRHVPPTTVPNTQHHSPQQVDPSRVNTHGPRQPTANSQPRQQRPQQPYHQIILHPSSPHQLSPLQVNTGQFSPQQRNGRDFALANVHHQGSPPGEQVNLRHLGPNSSSGSPPHAASQRGSPPSSDPIQQSYGLAVRTNAAQLHSPTAAQPPAGPQDLGPEGARDLGPNQPIEILPTGNAQLSWNLDSSFQSTV